MDQSALRQQAMATARAAVSLRDAETDQMILDGYARQQDFWENCLRHGVDGEIFRPVDVAGTARAIGLQREEIFTLAGAKNGAQWISKTSALLLQGRRFVSGGRKAELRFVKKVGLACYGWRAQ